LLEEIMKHLRAALLGLGFLTLCAAAPARADSTAQEVGYGAGSVFGTLLYAPFKTAFCVVGGVPAERVRFIGAQDRPSPAAAR
jgi:hypothetical protein